MTRDATLKLPSVRKAPKRQATDLESACNALHIRCVPESLPCRQEEFDSIYLFIYNKLCDGAGGVLYVSGVPGTGKTATITRVVMKLACDIKLPKFKVIHFNGMQVTQSPQIYVQLLKQLAIGLERFKLMSVSAAVQKLDEYFHCKKSKLPTVLIIDEMDLLCTHRQEVLYNLFDWSQQEPAKLIVVAIANTMDLPERMMHHKIASRMGMTRLVFQPYTFQQLRDIIKTRLINFNATMFDESALQLAVRKVAAISGDARRALDICRRALEIAQKEKEKVDVAKIVPTRKLLKNVKKGNIDEREPDVTMEHVKEAVAEMFAGPKLATIKNCSLYEKLFIKSMVAEFKRVGIEETSINKVFKQMDSLCSYHDLERLSQTDLFRIVARLASCKLLHAEDFRQDIKMKLHLNCSQQDVLFVLKDFDFDPDDVIVK